MIIYSLFLKIKASASESTSESESVSVSESESTSESTSISESAKQSDAEQQSGDNVVAATYTDDAEQDTAVYARMSGMPQLASNDTNRDDCVSDQVHHVTKITARFVLTGSMMPVRSGFQSIITGMARSSVTRFLIKRGRRHSGSFLM